MSATFSDRLVLVPFGENMLAFTLDQFTEALERGRSLVPSPAQPETTKADDRILDAQGMEEVTGIPSSWFLEQARRGEIPHLRAGKYRRFVVREVLEAIATRRPITETVREEIGRERRGRSKAALTRNAGGSFPALGGQCRQGK